MHAEINPLDNLIFEILSSLSESGLSTEDGLAIYSCVIVAIASYANMTSAEFENLCFHMLNKFNHH